VDAGSFDLAKAHYIAGKNWLGRANADIIVIEVFYMTYISATKLPALADYKIYKSFARFSIPKVVTAPSKSLLKEQKINKSVDIGIQRPK